MSGSDTMVGGSGYDLEQLSAYLDRGRSPRIAAIEDDAECQAVLASLERYGALSRSLVDEGARSEPVDASWFASLMGTVASEFRAGRDIPFPTSVPEVELAVTEGAVRELVRSAGDEVNGLVVTGCALETGVVPPTVRLTVSLEFGARVASVVPALRARIATELARHTPLTSAVVDVVVADVHEREVRR